MVLRFFPISITLIWFNCFHLKVRSLYVDFLSSFFATPEGELKKLFLLKLLILYMFLSEARNAIHIMKGGARIDYMEFLFSN